MVETFVKVDKSGKITFGIFGKEINSTILSIILGEDIFEFANNLKDFEKVCVYHGGLRLNEFPNDPTNLCRISTTKQLKHNQCCLVLRNNSVNCTRCGRLRNILNMQKEREEFKRKEVLLLSPSKKIIVDKLRRTKNNLYKKCIRAKQKIINLKLELNKIQNKIANVCDETIKEKLNLCQNMNESQKTLILECFAASKVRNTKSHRYTENCMMLCLLFNIRSPSAYKYLRNSGLLPLPHPKTIRSHLSLVKTYCGFDQDFLKLF